MKNSLKLAFACLLTLSITSPAKSISDTGKGFAFFAAGTALTAAIFPFASIFEKGAPTEKDLSKATEFLKKVYPEFKNRERLTREQYLEIREKIGLSNLALGAGASLAFLASAVFTTKAIFSK